MKAMAPFTICVGLHVCAQHEWQLIPMSLTTAEMHVHTHNALNAAVAFMFDFPLTGLCTLLLMYCSNTLS